MRYKNFLVFFAIVFLILQIPFSIADSNVYSDTGVPGVSNEDLDTLNKVTNLADSDNWESLTQSWKQKLLEEEFISDADSFLKAIDIVFVVFIGDSYSLSLYFFFIFVLWFFFLFQLKRIFELASIFSKTFSWIISFGLTIILAQLGFYGAISNFFIWLIFLPEESWMGIFVFLGIIAGLIFLGSITKIVDLMSKKELEKLEKIKEKSNRKILDTVVGGINEGMK